MFVNKEQRYRLRTLKLPVYGFTGAVLFVLYIITSFSPNSNQHTILDPEKLDGTRRCHDENIKETGICCPNTTNVIYGSKLDVQTYSQIFMSHSYVCDGGWKPSNCESIQQVAILIPFRDRETHLKLLLSRLHSILHHQNIAYRIFVLEQVGQLPFNRGLLFDIGILHAIKIDSSIDCFIFHDVDLLPQNSANLYLCDDNLRQLSSAIDDYRFHPPFDNNAGGVTALSKKNVFKINGFPTRFWGWGGEDDELSARAMQKDLLLTRPPDYLGRYHAPRHRKSSPTFDHMSSFRQFPSYLHDGLSFVQTQGYDLIRQSTLKVANWSSDLVKVPHNLNPCVLQSIAEIMDSTNVLVSDLNIFESFVGRELLDKSYQQALYTHLLINVTSFYHMKILPKQTNHPHQSWFWFLKFYGWI